MSLRMGATLEKIAPPERMATLERTGAADGVVEGRRVAPGCAE